jgi:hypothetical protein
LAPFSAVTLARRLDGPRIATESTCVFRRIPPGQHGAVASPAGMKATAPGMKQASAESDKERLAANRLKKKKGRHRDAEWHRAARERNKALKTLKPGERMQMQRPPAPTWLDQLRVSELGAQDHNARGQPKWMPSPRSVAQLLSEGDGDRTVFSVVARDVLPMLTWLAPQLALRFGRKISTVECPSRKRESFEPTGRTRSEIQTEAEQKAARETPKGELRCKQMTESVQRSAGVIISTKESSSGPHKDTEPSLVLSVSGSRKVWWASPAAGPKNYKPATNGASTHLPDEYDPSFNEPKKGITWSGPVILEAGDAIWIHEGWWHCILSEADGVAVTIEVQRSMVTGKTPWVFRHAAPTKSVIGKHSERRRVSRRQGWGDAAGVLQMWSHALAAHK